MQTRNSADFDDAVRERLQSLTEDHPQAEIARKTGFGKHNVSRYLKGTKIPAEFCCAVVSGLGVNPSWLLAGEGTPYLSDVTAGTANMAGNLLELVQSMNEVSKMRLGALTGKTHRKVLRQLDDALRDYEKLREQLNEQSRPFLRDLIVDYAKAVSRQDIERATHLRRAAHQLARLSDDEAQRRELNAVDAYFEYINKRVESALELQHKVFLGFLGVGEVDQRVFVEAHNYARALVDTGRIVEARGIVGATIELGRKFENTSRYQSLRAWRGWLEVQMGDLRRGLPELMDALPRMEERESRTIYGEAIMAQLLAGTLNWRAAMELGPNSVSRSAKLLLWCFWLRDAEAMSVGLKRFTGDEPWQALPDAPFADCMRTMVRVLEGDAKAYAPWRRERFEAERRRTSRGASRFHLHVQAASLALVAEANDARQFVEQSEEELQQLEPRELPDVIYRIMHARNILEAAGDSRAKRWLELKKSAGQQIRGWVDAGYLAARECLPG